MQLDVASITDCGFIGNWRGINCQYMSSIMSNWTRLTIADNDGEGFFVAAGGSDAATLIRNKISLCNFVRNCRGMTSGGGQLCLNGTGNIITENDFSEAGKFPSYPTVPSYDDQGALIAVNNQQPNIDDIRVHGDNTQIFGNQFVNHNSSGGCCVHVGGDASFTYIGPNLWQNNAYQQIIIDAGATDTTIVMCPGLVLSKITDNGTRTNYVPYTGTTRAIFVALPVYANNAAAITGGLVAGQQYRTGADPDIVAVVH